MTAIASAPLHVRWLGTRALPRGARGAAGAVHATAPSNTCCCSSIRTCSPTARAPTSRVNVLVDPASVGAELVSVKRGGDVTYHGPGQLVGYPIVTVSELARRRRPRLRDPARDRRAASRELGLADRRLPRRVSRACGSVSAGRNPRKICAIGVRLARGRTMHGFALNVAHRHALHARVHRPVRHRRQAGDVAGRGGHRRRRCSEVVDVVARHAAATCGAAARSSGRTSRGGTGPTTCRRSRAARARGAGAHGGRPRRRTGAGPSDGPAAAGRRHRGLSIATRKPEWLRPKVVHGPEVLALKQTVRDLGLVTVCEEAGCPNLSDCWADGTATFMVLGERCTRACGFCLVDTRKPLAPTPTSRRGSPRPSTAWVSHHAVLTMVARDDLADGGMAHVAACVAAIRERSPGTRIETLISDAKGDADVARAAVRRPARRVQPQRRDRRPPATRGAAVGRLRAQPGRARRAPRRAGLTVEVGARSSGMGETADEIDGCLADLAGDRRRHRHHRPVPAADVAPPAGRPVGRARRVRAMEAVRRGARHRPRRGQPADPQQLPRPSGRRCGVAGAGVVADRSAQIPDQRVARRRH